MAQCCTPAISAMEPEQLTNYALYENICISFSAIRILFWNESKAASWLFMP